MLRCLSLSLYTVVVCLASWAYLAHPVAASPVALSPRLVEAGESVRLPAELARQVQRTLREWRGGAVARDVRHLIGEEACQVDEPTCVVN